MIGVAAWWMQPNDAAPPRSLAILPFEGEAGAEDWFVDGVTGDLTAILSTWPEATVIGRGSTAAYKGKNVDPRELGRELGVRHVLTGRARREGDQVRLSVSLVDARSGRVAWSELRDVPRAELSALVGDVAGGIARTLAVEYGDAVAADARTLAPDQVRADDLAMQGIAELLRSVSREGWERSLRLFEEAVRIDPRLAARAGRRGAGQHQPGVMGMDRRPRRGDRAGRTSAGAAGPDRARRCWSRALPTPAWPTCAATIPACC